MESKMYLIQIKLDNDTEPYRTYVVTEDVRDKLVKIVQSEIGFCSLSNILKNGLDCLQDSYNNIAELTETKKSTKRKRNFSGDELHSDTTKSQSSQTKYFWTDKEKTEFIKLLHVYKKKWVKISSFLDSRDQTQCRSHGQKYLEALRLLLDIVNKLQKKSFTPTTDQLGKIKNYEFERKSLIDSFKDESGNISCEQDNLRFIPEYIYTNFKSQDEERNWRDQLLQISVSIQQELDFYNSKTIPQPVKQRRKMNDQSLKAQTKSYIK